MNIDNYTKQHKEIEELIASISKHLDSVSINMNLIEVHKMLLLLSGRLKFHLSVEDNALYPTMIKSSNPEAVSKAIQYQNEMGNLSSRFNKYIDKWVIKSSIQENIADFITETKLIFSALNKRITAENKELYILAKLC